MFRVATINICRTTTKLLMLCIQNSFKLPNFTEIVFFIAYKICFDFPAKNIFIGF